MRTDDSKHPQALSRRRLISLVASRFDFQLPVLLVFVAFVVAVSIFLFREIAADRFKILQGYQPLVFVSDVADGLGFGCELHCQGLTVGRVRAVRVEEKNGSITLVKNALGQEKRAPGRVIFRIEAALDKPYANWVFKDEATVKPGIGSSYLGLSTIELTVAEIRPTKDRVPPQVISLRFQEGRFAGIQEQTTVLLEALVQRSDLLGKRVDAGEASSLERTIWNLDRFTEKLDRAVTQLTVDGQEKPSPLKRMVESADRLGQIVDKLGFQVEELSRESTRTVQESRKAVQKLEATIAQFHRNSLEVVGETPAQRKAIRMEMIETLNNLRSASLAIKELVPRVGETGFGHLLIKKKTKEPMPSPTPKH